MILKSEGLPVVNHAGKQEKIFTMKASAHAFKVLANNLYSNKIPALVRELSCNAYDAHVEGRNSDPFVVHCPNYLEPWFSVQDWGMGIPHEFMMGDYTTAFYSTKNDSNESIGGLGLGRLSAFAYSDSYSAISVYNGVKRHYIVYLAESGFPTVNFTQESPTDEKNGFTVTVPVKSDNFYEFQNVIRNFFQEIDAPYKITGSSISITPPSAILEGTGWKKYERGSGKTYARMGLVQYPVYLNHSVTEANIVVDFPIGSLDITPSREALSYSVETNQLLQAKFDEIQAEVHQLMQAKIEAATTLWEAKTILHDIHRGDYSSLALNQKFTYLKEPLHVALETTIPVVRWYSVSNRGRSRPKYDTVSLISPGGVYCIEDGCKHSVRRIKQNLPNYKSIYIFDSKADLTTLKEAGVPLTLLSDLPFTPPAKPIRKKSQAQEVLFWENGEFVPFPDSIPSKSLYISCSFRDIKKHLDKIHRYEYDLAILGESPDIFWVSPKYLPKVQGCVDFYDFAELFISTAVEEKAKNLKLEQVPGSLKTLFYSLSAIGVAEKLVEPLSQQENIPTDLLNLINRRGLTIETSTEVATSMEEFLAKHPMLRLVDSYKINSNPDIIKDYVALHC